MMEPKDYLTMLFPWDAPIVGAGSELKSKRLYIYILDCHWDLSRFGYNWYLRLDLADRRYWVYQTIHPDWDLTSYWRKPA